MLNIGANWTKNIGRDENNQIEFRQISNLIIQL